MKAPCTWLSVTSGAAKPGAPTLWFWATGISRPSALHSPTGNGTATGNFLNSGALVSTFKMFLRLQFINKKERQLSLTVTQSPIQTDSGQGGRKMAAQLFSWQQAPPRIFSSESQPGVGIYSPADPTRNPLAVHSTFQEMHAKASSLGKSNLLENNLYFWDADL